jgi:PAS domain S-box-containing protein
MSDDVAHPSSRYQRLLMERVPSMLAYWDVNLRCRFANRAYEQWFGVDPSSLVGTSLRDLLGPELFALNEPHVRAVLSGKEQSFERVVPGPGGVHRDSLANYVPDVVDGTVVGFVVQVTDVSALKAAQAALEHSEEYLRELFSLSTEGALIADREGRYIDVNDACCDMLGYAREELLGKTFEDLLCSTEIARLPQARTKLHAGDRHIEEWALRRKDGGVVAIEVRAKFLNDGRRVGFLRDITMHKRALAAERDSAGELERRVQQRTLELERAHQDLQRSHEALHASEQRYHTLVDWLPEAIAVHRAGKLIYANRSAVVLFGARSEQDLLGKPILHLIHPDFHRFVLERVKSAAAQGMPSSVAEIVLVKLDGARIDAEIQGTSILYDDQPAILASIRDVTARKLAEEALGRSKARLRGIVDSTTDSILTADETQTIVSANPAAAEMFRCTVHDMIGAPLERFIPERFRESHRRDVHEFGESSVSARHMGRARDAMGRVRDVIGLRTDGEEFLIDVAISHLNVDGKPMYTAILRDVTERRRIEGELRTGNATLEAALHSMSDAVCISDVQGRFINFNEAFATFHRFANKEECRKTLAEYPALLEAFMANGEPVSLDQWAVPRALRGETATGVEYRLRRKDTGQTWIGSYSFAPIRSPAGQITGSVVSARDVTELTRGQTEFELAHADLQRLIAAKDTVQEDERRRIARDLHDDLQQTLAAIRIDVGVIDQNLAADPAAVAPMLARVDELASAAIASTRRIVNDLQPQALQDLGLVAALELLARQFSERTGIACQIEASDTLGDAASEASSMTTSLYRIAQEALNNVVKHAHASVVNIRLASAEGGKLELRIADNGEGMSVADRKKAQSFGLLGMQERVRSLGGELRIESQLGIGTAIEVVVPAGGTQAGMQDVGPTDRGSVPTRGEKREHASWRKAPGKPTASHHRGRAGTDLPRPNRISEDALQRDIDAQVGHIAVLDSRGVIRLVNRAWREFAERNGDPELLVTGPGVNNLDVCRRSARTDKVAQRVLEGSMAVLDGSVQAFTCVYPCHSADEQRWFLLHITPMAGGGCMLSHFNLTSWVDPAWMAKSSGADR